jgi:hypothetical protein
MTRTPLPLHRRFLPHTHGLEDVAILTDHDLQRMYELAYGVHAPLSAVVLTRRTVAQFYRHPYHDIRQAWRTAP